jgi:hypothetical protein
MISSRSARQPFFTPRPIPPFTLISLRKGFSRAMCFGCGVAVEAKLSSSALACLGTLDLCVKGRRATLNGAQLSSRVLKAKRLRQVDEREGTIHANSQEPSGSRWSSAYR